MVKYVNAENLEELIANSDKTVYCDFWASWCGPCRMVSPVVDEIAEERTDIKVGKVDIDESTELAIQHRVMSVPTLIVMKDGKEQARAVGYRAKQEVLAMLNV